MISECALSQVVKAMSKTALPFVVKAVFSCLAFRKADVITFKKFVFWPFCTLKLKSPKIKSSSDKHNFDKDITCFL